MTSLKPRESSLLPCEVVLIRQLLAALYRYDQAGCAVCGREPRHGHHHPDLSCGRVEQLLPDPPVQFEVSELTIV